MKPHKTPRDVIKTQKTQLNFIELKETYINQQKLFFFSEIKISVNANEKLCVSEKS